MTERKIKIVADSSSDVRELAGVSFDSAPLKISTESREFVDDLTLDVRELGEYMRTSKGRSHTACPSIGDWLSAFGDADEVFVVTITATLSGSYNSAMNAKRAYEEENPKRRVYVINSLSTGPEMALVIEKLRDLALLGLDFDAICDAINNYMKKTGLLFILESLRNLANNGRVSQLVAKMAGMLGIRMVGKASDGGDLQPLHKCRGERAALVATFTEMQSLGYAGGRCKIHHCINEEAALTLRSLILEKFPDASVEVALTRGLCCFYAELGGLLIGFEKA
jgi:DegV family protein with EDD domain